MDEDQHLAKAQAELDEAILLLNKKVAELASGKKNLSTLNDPLPVFPKLDSSSAEGEPASDLIDRFVNSNLKDLVEDKSSQSWRSKISGMVYSLLPLSAVALGFVGKTMEGSTLSLPVSGIAKGACCVVTLVLKERDRRTQFLNEVDRISYQARRVHEIQRQPDTVLLPLLREKAMHMLTAIALFLVGTIDFLGRNILKQVTKSVFRGTDAWSESLTCLQRAYEEYDQALLLQVASTVLTHHARAQQQADLAAAEDSAFRQWLQPSFAENEARMMANLGQRAEGTLHWVLDLPELRTWRMGDASSEAKTLWLTGLPGVGKSCIAAYLCELLPQQYPDDIHLSFFCKRGTTELTTAFALLRTLCYQLTRENAFYRKFLQKMPNLPSTTGKEGILFLVDTLLRRPLAAGLGDSAIFIVLDGLDELENTAASKGPSYDGKTDVEVLLGQLITLPRVKILATSRSLAELHSILSDSGDVRQIGPADNAMDIENYVAHRVEKSEKLRTGFSDLKIDPVEFFSGKANGIFLWVAIVLDVLERAPSSNSFKKGLDEIHPTMNSIYDDIFAGAEQRQTLSLMMEILNWTLILPSPFTVRQMAVAVEISLDDRVLKMEEFLRTECGALLNLIPRLGAGAVSDDTLEIHIGHETFQTWLAEKLGEDKRRAAHARAATTCLKCLLDKQPDTGLKSYALEKWKWHLRHSLGAGEPQFADPMAGLKTGKTVPAPEAIDLFHHLYLFLSRPEVEAWIEARMEKVHFDHVLFWDIHMTQLEVMAWCGTNSASLSDDAIDGLQADDGIKEQLKIWRDSLEDPRIIAQMLWPRVCHAWLWNTSLDWWTVLYMAEVLTKLFHYAYGEGILEETPEGRSILDEETNIAQINKGSGVKHGGQLLGSLTMHMANTMVRSNTRKYTSGPITEECLEAVKKAGRYNELSGVCAANLAIVYFQQQRNADDKDALEKSLEFAQEAIDDDPDEAPRNYYHLAQVYKTMRNNAYFEDEKQRLEEQMLESLRDAVARDPDHTTDARCELYQAEVYALLRDPPDVDGAIAKLEFAIVDNPEEACSRWFHQLFDLHKKRGDLEAARETYRRQIAFDPPSWHTRWKDIADTWIDDKQYRKTRTFDYRNWCDALLEAIEQDPSYAHSYWSDWASKAESLVGYNHFGFAAEILAYGVEKSAERTDPQGRRACAKFLLELGEVQGQMFQWEESIARLEEAWAREASMDIWERRRTLQYLAWAYMGAQRWDDVTAAGEKRLALAPHENWGDNTRYNGRWWKGEAALLGGKPAAAVKELKNAIAMLEESLAADQKGSTKSSAAAPPIKPILNEDIGLLFIDLGHAYERMGRQKQAVAMFKRAIPHVEYEMEQRVQFRTLHNTMWRREGRWRMLLGWLLERIHGRGEDARVLELYEFAVTIFEATCYVEDDFIEIADLRDAREAVQRVRAGVAWEAPSEEEFQKRRLMWKIAFKRSDWANGHFRDEVQKTRRRGSG